jgi:hypothetical protein
MDTLISELQACSFVGLSSLKIICVNLRNLRMNKPQKKFSSASRAVLFDFGPLEFSL